MESRDSRASEIVELPVENSVRFLPYHKIPRTTPGVISEHRVVPENRQW